MLFVKNGLTLFRYNLVFHYTQTLRNMKKSFLLQVFFLTSLYYCSAQISATTIIPDDRGSVSNTTSPHNYTNAVLYDQLNFLRSQDNCAKEVLKNQINDKDEFSITHSPGKSQGSAQVTQGSAYTPLIRLSPEFATLFNNAAKEFSAKHYEFCINICDNIIESNPDYAEAYFLKGASYFGLKDTENSLKYFKIASDKGSKDAKDILKQLK